MKLQFPSFVAIVAYYCTTFAFLFWQPDSFVKDTLVAPLYFLVPAGIGLLLLSINGIHHKLLDWLSKPQILLSGFFVGFVAMTLVYQELERQITLRTVFVPVYFALLGSSMFGYYRTRELMEVDSDVLRRRGKTFLWLVPVAAVTYYFHYIHFTSFPLRDIFQQTHFMKGALEFSQTQILNPYITGSHLPYIQIALGQLHHFYGFDLFRAQWILPLFVFIFNLSCYAVFIATVTHEHTAQKFALMLMIVLAPVFQLENMIILESMMLVLLSMLLRMDVREDSTVPFKINITLLLVFFVGYHFYFDYYFSPPVTDIDQPPAHYTSMWVFAFLVFLIFSLLRDRGVHITTFIILFAVSAFAVHRAILLFIPIILFIYSAHHFIRQSGNLFAPTKIRALSARVATALVIALITVLVFWLSGSTDVSVKGNDESPAFTGIAGYLLRTPVFVGGGTGINHSLVEYLRLMPPLLHVLIVSLLVWFVHGKLQSTGLKQQSGIVLAIGETSPWFLIATLPILIAVVLSTIPYVYRGGFFPMTLGIVLFSTLATRFLESQDTGCKVVCRVIAAFIAVYLMAAASLWYNPAHSFLGIQNTYLAALGPFILVLLVVALAGLAGMVLVQKSGRARYVGFMAAVIGAVAFDVFAFRTLFYEKAFRDHLPESGVISHYTKQELVLAEKLRPRSVKTILVSDPYTLSILRAATGFNSVYSFANINIVTNPGRYLELFQYLRSLEGTRFSREKAERLVTMADGIRKTAASESMYIWNRTRVDDNKDLVPFDAFYDNFVWVLSAKTLSWAEGRGGYYPDNSPLPDSLVESLKQYFDIEINMDNRLLAMKLKHHKYLGVAPRRTREAQECVCPD